MRIAYDAIMLREQTAVLQPERLHNTINHHYEMVRVSRELYTIIPALFLIRFINPVLSQCVGRLK